MLACPWNLGARALVNNYFWGARVAGGTVLACGLPSNGLPLLLRTPIYVMRIMISGVPHSTEGYNYRVLQHCEIVSNCEGEKGRVRALAALAAWVLDSSWVSAKIADLQ
jgi:hypothetical protein